MALVAFNYLFQHIHAQPATACLRIQSGFIQGLQRVAGQGTNTRFASNDRQGVLVYHHMRKGHPPRKHLLLADYLDTGMKSGRPPWPLWPRYRKEMDDRSPTCAPIQGDKPRNRLLKRAGWCRESG